MSRRNIATIIASISLATTAFAYAYSVGFCQVAGCSCHQYVGGSGAQDPCANCGHKRIQHS